MPHVSSTREEARPATAIDAGAFYDTHFPLVYAYLRRRVSDTETAEDLTSTTFERILVALDSFTPRGDAETATRVWVYRIAGNVYKNWLRSSERENNRNEAWASEWRSDRNRDAQATTGRVDGDLGLALGAAVSELDEHDRDVVGLRYWEGLTAREIADVVGCSQREVYTTLDRCVRQLRRRLAPTDKEQDGVQHDEPTHGPGRRGAESEPVRQRGVESDAYARHGSQVVGARRSG